MACVGISGLEALPGCVPGGACRQSQRGCRPLPHAQVESHKGRRRGRDEEQPAAADACHHWHGNGNLDERVYSAPPFLNANNTDFKQKHMLCPTSIDSESGSSCNSGSSRSTGRRQRADGTPVVPVSRQSRFGRSWQHRGCSIRRSLCSIRPQHQRFWAFLAAPGPERVRMCLIGGQLRGSFLERRSGRSEKQAPRHTQCLPPIKAQHHFNRPGLAVTGVGLAPRQTRI